MYRYWYDMGYLAWTKREPPVSPFKSGSQADEAWCNGYNDAAQ